MVAKKALAALFVYTRGWYACSSFVGCMQPTPVRAMRQGGLVAGWSGGFCIGPCCVACHTEEMAGASLSDHGKSDAARRACEGGGGGGETRMLFDFCGPRCIVSNRILRRTFFVLLSVCSVCRGGRFDLDNVAFRFRARGWMVDRRVCVKALVRGLLDGVRPLR